MAYENRAYTADYSYLGQEVPQRQRQPLWEVPPERVKRTREKPQIHTEPEAKPAGGLTGAELTKYIVLLVFAGALLIATIFLTAMATDIKYSVNKVTKENIALENDISMLSVKLETANSIESIEEYAVDKLKMRYPKDEQCIYITDETPAPENLARTIREKAYGEATKAAE